VSPGLELFGSVCFVTFVSNLDKDSLCHVLRLPSSRSCVEEFKNNTKPRDQDDLTLRPDSCSICKIVVDEVMNVHREKAFPYGVSDVLLRFSHSGNIPCRLTII
jgi:hypothetical protein